MKIPLTRLKNHESGRRNVQNKEKAQQKRPEPKGLSQADTAVLQHINKNVNTSSLILCQFMNTRKNPFNNSLYKPV